MNITFKSEEEQLIQQKIKSGKYATAYDVIVEALRLLEERDERYEQWVEETRKKVQWVSYNSIAGKESMGR